MILRIVRAKRERMEEQMERDHSTLNGGGGQKNQLERHYSKNSRNTKLCKFS